MPQHTGVHNVVVVADADEEVRCIVADALDALRLHIIQAANVYEVFEWTARGGLRLVVTELMMPGADHHYVKELRRHLPDCPILVVTDLDGIAKKEAMADGASAYLKKPFRVRELRRLVTGLLGGGGGTGKTAH